MNARLAGVQLLTGLALVELLQLAALAEDNGHLVGHLGLVLLALEHGRLLELHWTATGVALLIVWHQGDGAGEDGLVLAQLLLDLLLVLGVQHLWAGVVAGLRWALDGGVGEGGVLVAGSGQVVD